MFPHSSFRNFRYLLPTAEAVLLYFATLILLLFITNPVFAALRDTVVRVKPAVVGVGTLKPTARPPAQLRGSGFVVGNGHYAVTNAHVVDHELDTEHQERIAVFIGVGQQADVRSAELIAIDHEHDIALLQFGGNPVPTMMLGDADSVREGDEVAFTGFPIGAVLGLFPVTHHGIVAAISPVATPVVSPKDLDVKMMKRLKDPFDVFQLDATAYPGNSGSAVYDAESGRVIGIINKVFVKETKETVLEKPSGITYAIPVRHLRDMLEKNKIAY